MNGVPSFAITAGSTWNALQASGNQPSICRPLTGGVVGCVYFELSVPEPGGGNPIPVRLCGSVYGLFVVVRSATWWQSIHSAPRSCFHAEAVGDALVGEAAQLLRESHAGITGGQRWKADYAAGDLTWTLESALTGDDLADDDKRPHFLGPVICWVSTNVRQRIEPMTS